MLKRIFLFFLPVFAHLFSSAQNITGSWEGDLGNDQFIQLNVVQTREKVCGYTWDYVYGERTKSYCRQYFSGFYDAAKQRWFLQGNSFMEQRGGHSLIQLMFSVVRDGKTLKLDGWCRAGTGIAAMMDDPMDISLTRVSATPAMYTDEMKDCVKLQKLSYAKPPKKTPPAATPPKPAPKPVTPAPKPVPAKPVPAKPVPAKPLPAKPIAPKVQPDTGRRAPILKPNSDSAAIIKKPVAVQPIVKTLPAATAGRINKETGRIVVTQPKIQLYLYDNATVDGDSVAIYYNGKMILQHQRLSEKAVVVDVDLDTKVSLHSIVMYAENLGSIPPNTALIVCRDSNGKRYELFAKATLEENAQLVFEYKP